MGVLNTYFVVTSVFSSSEALQRHYKTILGIGKQSNQQDINQKSPNSAIVKLQARESSSQVNNRATRNRDIQLSLKNL